MTDGQGGRPDAPVVVITGGSSGIGRASAHEFAKRGAQLVLAARSAESLAAAAAECTTLGAADVLSVPTDVTDEAAVQALQQQVVAQHGHIDVWVHSAAVMAYGRFDETPPDVFRRVLETEFFGVVHSARAVLPHMRARGSGTFVIVNSLLGKIVAPYMSAYVASKWGLRGLTRALQLENRDKPGVHICEVSPGSVNTPIYRLGANYTGRGTRPPPPVVEPAKVARAVLRCVDRPRRTLDAGPGNAFMVLGFRLLPPVYDRLVTPLMHRLGLTNHAMQPTAGNVFEPNPAGNRVRGRWAGILGRETTDMSPSGVTRELRPSLRHRRPSPSPPDA